MVRRSHWSAEGYRLCTYVTFTRHLNPCSSMVRRSHWSSEGYMIVSDSFVLRVNVEKLKLNLFNVDIRMEVVAQSSEPWAHI